MKNVAVFASGSGSNMQAVIDYNNEHKFCNIKLLIASKPNIYAIERANKNGIDYRIFDKNDFDGLDEMFLAIDFLLKEKAIDIIVLAGYLTIIPKSFTDKYKNKIINIHPSLIPSFCGDKYFGLAVHKKAIEYGVKISGCTVHFVDETADGGAIIMQAAVEVNSCDTAESLQKKVLEKEHKLLPLALKYLCENKIDVVGRTVIIKE